MALTCRELVEVLDEYLAGSLAGPALEEFEKHLSDCPGCATYLQTYRDSIRLGRGALQASDDAVPEGIPEELVQAILAARQRRQPS